MIPNHPYDVLNKTPFSKWEGVESSKLYLVHTMSEWRAFFDLLMSQKLVGCDTETSGFRYWIDHIVGMSFGWKDTHFYIPVRHEDSVLEGKQLPQLNMESLKKDLMEFFSQKDVFTLWHNAKFDFHFYQADGINIKTPFHDTRILWQLYDENAPGALKTIATGWTDPNLGIKYEGLVGRDANISEQALKDWRARESRARRSVYKEEVKSLVEELRHSLDHQDKNKLELRKWVEENLLLDHPYRDVSIDDVHYGFVPIPLMTEYAATDTYLTYKLYEHVVSHLPMTPELSELYINEIKLSNALLDAESTGVKISRPYLEQLDVELEKEKIQLEYEIKQELGDINLNSTQQLSQALINAGVSLTRTTGSGAVSVDKKVLEKLQDKHEIINKILKLRGIEKLHSTYVKGILAKLTEDDILHCSFNQNVSTGRMSSVSPNLQNIPNSDDRIRKSFICPDDYVYVFADYSQVEVRLTAHYSEDPLLLDAYKKDQDVHTRTMCEMFGYDYEEAIKILEDENHVKYKQFKQERNIAKRINFGIIYGVGAPGLSEQIPRPAQYKDLSEKEWIRVCQNYIDQYMQKYIGVRRFINQSGRQIRKNAYVTNHFGRVRHLPHAKADKIKGKEFYWVVGRAQRQGTNFLIQGTAADVFKIAVVRTHDLFKNKKSHMVNFVHDEIQSYVHKSELGLLDEWKHRMEDFDFIVPLVADFAYSKYNWGDKREMG